MTRGEAELDNDPKRFDFPSPHVNSIIAMALLGITALGGVSLRWGQGQLMVDLAPY